MPPDHRSFLWRRSDVLAGPCSSVAPKGAAMSTTDNDGGSPSGREPERAGARAGGSPSGRPSQRLHGLYRADLRPFEPVSDAQILDAIDRVAVQPHDDFLPYFQATQQFLQHQPAQGGAESGSDGGPTLVRHHIEIRSRGEAVD